jgi:hypothetical protein
MCFEAPSSLSCPTGAGEVTGGDLSVVLLLGLVGGALSAAVAVRTIRGASPYSVPLALALLKLPMGALTAVLGLILVRGEFVPGLSQLDSQQQILAYAVVLGYAQQLATRLVDRRAQEVLDQGNVTEQESNTSAPNTGPDSQSLDRWSREVVHSGSNGGGSNGHRGGRGLAGRLRRSRTLTVA